MNERNCKIILFITVLIVVSGYANNNHVQNVKFQIVEEATREPLKNCELNICKFVYFKLPQGEESPYIDKQAEWFITSVTTDEYGVFELDFSSIKDQHIVVEPGQFYDITRFSRTSDLTGTKAFDHIKVTHFQQGLTNRIYDLNSGKVKIITDSGKITEDAFANILLEVRRREYILCSEAETSMLQFQRALKNLEWDEAISLCSDAVKSKASDYNSSEVFFKEFVPVYEIVSLPKFQSSGGTYDRQRQRIEYRCFLRIPTEGSIEAVDWIWSIRKNNEKWLIDFDTVPLKKLIEKEVIRRTKENAESRRRLDRMRKGFEIKLTALNEEFVIGRPMLFHVEMQNISKSPIRLMGTSSPMVNDSMLIKGPDGNVIPYIDTSYQTVGTNKEIEPGEKIILAEKYDVTTQYCIRKSGRYTFQFNGFKHYEINPSNIVEVNVIPGKLLPADSIIEKLLTVLPKDWELTRTMLTRHNTSEKTSDAGFYINLMGQSGRKGINAGICVLMLVVPTENEIAAKPETFRNCLWGRSKWGDVYVKSFDADILWPEYKGQIIKALEIE